MRAIGSIAAPVMKGALHGRRTTPHLFALAILACAILLRVIVPQGWMPVETAQGWRVTICTGTGPMQMEMRGPGHAPRDQDHASGDHACAFSSLAMALDSPSLDPLALPEPILAVAFVRLATTVTVGRGLAAPPPPATGPPATV